MPTLHIHTHCQVAQKPKEQTKTCQRVWLPALREIEEKARKPNNLYMS